MKPGRKSDATGRIDQDARPMVRASLCMRHHAAFRRGNFQSGRAKWQV
jgi:hypothetical protein